MINQNTPVDNVRYNIGQDLTESQKNKARANIDTSRCQRKLCKIVHEPGWYRVLRLPNDECGGILTLAHQYYSHYSSYLTLLVTASQYIPSLKCIDYPHPNMPFKNGMLVKTKNGLAVDMYYAYDAKNSARLTFIDTGFLDNAELVDMEFISSDGSIPVGESLITMMEFLNPPMEMGVEYRTTKRYKGKPVYTQLMNWGAAPAKGEIKTVAVPQNSSNQRLIHAELTYYGITFPRYDDTGNLVMYIYTGQGAGYWYIHSPGEDRSDHGNIEAIVEYTKTTD